MRIAFSAVVASLAVAMPAMADVYIGATAYARDLIARPQDWADVRADASGYYLRSGNASDLKSGEPKQIVDLIQSHSVLTERDKAAADGDRPQYDLLHGLGLTPAGGIVAQTAAGVPWANRVAQSKYVDSSNAVHVPLYTDERPWTSVWSKIVNSRINDVLKTDGLLADRVAIIDHADGLALQVCDVDSTTRINIDLKDKDFSVNLKLLEFAQAKNKQTLLFLNGFEKSDVTHYVESNLNIVRLLEAAGTYPNAFVVNFDDANTSLPLLPETTLVDGQRYPANTLTGLVWAVLARENQISLTPAESPKVKVLDAAGHETAIVPIAPDKPADFSIIVTNPNHALDFAPALFFDLDGAVQISYAFGSDPLKPMGANDIRFAGPYGVRPDSSQTVRLHVEWASVPGKGVNLKVYYRPHAFGSESLHGLLVDVVGPAVHGK